MSLGQDLADFLLARIAEDEFAVQARAERVAAQLTEVGADPTGDVTVKIAYKGALIALPGTTRMLAECDAKRKIVEELRTVSAHADTEYDSGRVCAFTASLLLLADVYADHQDYDETWRP